VGDAEPTPTSAGDQILKPAKLLDAGLLVFMATALSLGTSVLYVFGTAWGLHFPVQNYFGLSDYLGITPYWLGWVMAAAVFFAYNYSLYFLRAHSIKKREPEAKRILWFLKNYWPYLVTGSLLVAGWFAYDWYIAACLCGLFAGTYLSSGLSVLLITKYVSRFPKTPLTLRLALFAALPISTFAFGFGYIVTPAFLEHEKVSEVFLIGSQPDANASQLEKSIKGRVLFSLSQYVIILRSDEVFVSLPVARIGRIETPKDELSGPKGSPTASASPTVKPILAPAVTATPRSTPISTPSALSTLQSSATTPAAKP
jgi:hypothetical protein